MTSVERNYNVVRKYRQGLNEINSRYDEQIEAKRQYLGSEGYTKDVEEIEKKRMSEISALREDCGESFDFCIAAMQKAAQSRPVTAPTEEQLRILETLKMRESLTRDDLTHESNAMSDCPLALGVLEELARKHEILGFHAGGTCVSDEFVNDAIREFAKSARTILTLDRANGRRELMDTHGMGDGPNGSIPSMETIAKFRVDVDTPTPEETASRFGGISTDLYEAFCEAVSPSTKNT